MTQIQPQPTKVQLSAPNLIRVSVVAVGLVVASLALAKILPQETDWTATYRPAALALISAQSPYQITNYVAPPWILIPLVPIAVLPPRLGQILIFWLSIVAFAILMRKNGARLLSVLALIVSYPVIYGLIYGQIDWLVMLGLLFPPWLGIVLLMGKPQIGIGVALYLGYEAWIEGRIKKLILLFLPLAGLALISYLLFGPDALTKSRLYLGWSNTSLWPRSIPIGLVVLVAAIRQKRKFVSLTASPFLSPYVPVHSWASVMVGLSNDPWYPILISICTWVIWALGGGAVNG
jgi:hypothetical protein